MPYALDQFRNEIHTAIAATGLVAAALIETQTPKSTIPADLAFPAFRAAKERHVPPPQLVQELAALLHFGDESLVGEVKATGPFLNLGLHPQRFAAAVVRDILTDGDRYGFQALGSGRTIVIDYSAPNIAKRLHVGHIRSTIIGQALVNMFRALGYRVVGDNHLGDWGTQFGTIIASIKRFGQPQIEGEAALEQLESIYSRYSNEAKAQPALEEEARHWSLRLEQGDPQARELWQWCVDLTLRASQRNYDRLGIRFDHAYGESFYESMLAGVIEEALTKGVAFRDAGGAVVVDQLADKIPTFLLQRSDGGTLYMTRDVATILFRLKQFTPERVIYVVGAPQELHFRQLFTLVKAMGHSANTELVHIAFGTVFDTEGVALSTRRGNMVYLESLLDDAIVRARAIVEAKKPDLPADEKQAVAEAVGVGAVVYNDLYQDTRRNIVLDWERMLALEGNSATYLQYSHARCCSIFRRAAEQGIEVPTATSDSTHLLVHPAEQKLLKHLARLPEALREATERYAPFVIADWCYTSAREFGSFFEQCSVLQAENNELRTARLLLVKATGQALKNGLALLGIRAPERM